MVQDTVRDNWRQNAARAIVVSLPARTHLFYANMTSATNERPDGALRRDVIAEIIGACCSTPWRSCQMACICLRMPPALLIMGDVMTREASERVGSNRS